MAFRQMRYKYEDGVMLKNIFPSDSPMAGWSLDPDTAMNPEVKKYGDSSGHSVRSGRASKSKTDKREPSSDEPI